jgi:glycosyltransferase involved in cell wall biosynthesis/CDP-glycerol glycerophosphotransferase (TagB/SpsB family)
LGLPRRLFSVVTAVYNVEPYLPDFIASIEGQRFDLQRLEVIAVDDGSTDGSLALLQEWARRSPGLVKVATKSNGGQSSARNLGLEHATGEWVTFTDPDDMLDSNFFKVAHRFAVAHPDVEVLAGKPVLLLENLGRIRDQHPRRQQYDAGNRQVNLEDEPNTFTGSASVSLFKLDRIRALGLGYDTRVRPNFEADQFAVHYLMGLPEPVVGVLRDAKYIYRKRATNNSTLQQDMSHPGRYSDVLKFGYLEVLQRARARYGRVPPWLQHVIISELCWYLETDEENVSPNIRISPELIPRFHDLFSQVIRYLDPEVVWSHTVPPLKSVWADLFAHAGRIEDWHSAVAVRTKIDRQMGLQRICYRYVGAPPGEEFLVDGSAVQPAFSKTMSHTYARKTLMNERIVWLPSGMTSRVLLDGASVTIVTTWPQPSQPARSNSIRERLWLYRRLPAAYLVRALARRGRASLGLLQRRPLRLLARALPYRSRFRDAWVVMDRIDDADDNGERLFEYLLAERPDINAWFVLEKSTPDWKRMRAAGVPRLVAYGSFQWKMLMLNCAWVLSSHADVEIVKPGQITRITGQPTWKFAFLEHGVTDADYSVWLNELDFDMFVVSTQAELESILADGTSYRYTAKETKNTGLPRWDRLLAKGRQFSPKDRDLILVAPTYRRWLWLLLAQVSGRPQAEQEFWNSEYFRNWNALLLSPRIAEAAARRGRRVAFMPHPRMQAILARMGLPAHIQLLAFAGNDVQELYARCALLVTDYSSVAFNAAYLDRPVVYFQFDREQIMSGGHLGRQGYYEYLRDGFGPVVIDVPEAETAIVATIDNGPCPAAEYQTRIDQIFPNRDGRACARVVAAIEELSRPYRPPGTA